MRFFLFLLAQKVRDGQALAFCVSRGMLTAASTDLHQLDFPQKQTKIAVKLISSSPARFMNARELPLAICRADKYGKWMMSSREATTIEKWKQLARRLKLETYTLYLAYRDPRTPWYARPFAALVVGYAFSPIDLIPDFIPVLGHLDDLVLIPLGIWLALRMIPTEVMEDCRGEAELLMASGKPVNKFAGIGIVLIWLTLALASILLLIKLV